MLINLAGGGAGQILGKGNMLLANLHNNMLTSMSLTNHDNVGSSRIMQSDHVGYAYLHNNMLAHTHTWH